MTIDLQHKRPEPPKGVLARLLEKWKNPGPREPRYKGDRDLYPTGAETAPHRQAQLREIMRGMTLDQIEATIKEQRQYVNDLHYAERDGAGLLQDLLTVSRGQGGWS